MTKSLLDEARALNRVGEPGEAVESLRVLYRNDPANREVVLLLGGALMRAGKFAVAEDLWNAALATDPDIEEAWVQRARAVEARGDPILALAAWDAVLQRRPEDAEATKRRRKLSQMLFNLGRDAIAVDDGMAAAGYMQAVPLEATERSAAEAKFDRSGRILLKAMRVDYKLREFAEVVAAGSVGRDIASGNVDLHRLLAKAAAKLRRSDVAVAAWEHLATLQDGASVRIEIAIQRAALGEFAAAAAALAAAAAFDPTAEGLAEVRRTIATGQADGVAGTPA